MSYFSEEDQENEEDQDNEGDDLSSEESIDEDTKNIFLRATYNNTYEIEVESSSEKKTKKKTQTKASLSLQHFVKKVESEKPGKFVSKRVQSKTQTILKRGFNPRLLPYNFVHKKNVVKEVNLNEIEFPSL
jgi:hypothetical protein